MQSSTKWFFLGALLSLVSCKSDPPAPKVTAESARVKPAAAPSASAVASASSPALAPYGMDDVLRDMEHCAGSWQRSFGSRDERCDKLLALWSEGGVEAAVAKYKSGCANKDGKSCRLLLGAVGHPKSGMQAKDMADFSEKIAEILVMGCKFGEANSCVEIVSRTGCMDENPVYQLPAHVCTKHVIGFLKGKTDADLAALLDPGCKQGHAVACTKQARYVEKVKGQIDEVTDLYRRACNLGDAMACAAAAAIAEKFGFDAERQSLLKKEFEWEERDCRRLSECLSFARYYSSSGDNPERLRTIRDVLTGYCAKENSKDSACLTLAQMQVKGAGGPVDIAAAVPRLEGICDDQMYEDYPARDLEPISIACRTLSNFYKNGTGVPKDEAKAKALMKRACIQRDPSTPEIDAACAELKAMGK